MASIPRDDVAATLAARRELGTDYEDALADALVERIGTTIDERIDAKLATQERRKGTFNVTPSAAAVVSGLGLGGLFAVIGSADLEFAAVLWLILAVAAVAFLLGKWRAKS
ncbi:hypothetical protein DQ384_13945 [Sphaerisporangium album]|uniref:Uncharacterized protein n=1 Tax=Sphaerisporangium album TaxID=509200 RepID=A0A367FLA7_9ACTN|nr:hypothetical protein [Sphaerisporangium album]RCG31041.1 hypothetical protein DQ384_13945 [Sphaerisporangium album]